MDKLRFIYLRLARIDVSCRSPGSNSWEPFRPNSSQPRRNTVRLSWRKTAGSHLKVYCSAGQTAECLLTRPAMGVGSLLIFLTRPGLMALSSLHMRGKQRQRFIGLQWSLSVVLPCGAAIGERSTLTRITGCRSPMHCGSPCLQSFSLLPPEEGGQEETDVKAVS